MENCTLDNDGFNSLKNFLDPSYLKKERNKCYIHPGSLTFEDDDLRELFKYENNFRFDTYFKPKDLSEIKEPHQRKFSSILLIKYFDKYYICNRNQHCIFGLKKPDYMKWWGLPIGRIFNYTATDVKVICRFNGIGNERHRHQASLNIVKDDVRDILKNDYPQLLDNEYVCDEAIQKNVKPLLGRMKYRRRELLSVMKQLSFSQILWYINELKIIFANNPGYKTPVIDFCYNDGSVISSNIINEKYNDKYPRFHCRENYLRWEALDFVPFCQRYFKFRSEEEMFNKIRTVSYYWNIYAVYVCCFLEGYGDYDLSLINVNNDKKKY